MGEYSTNNEMRNGDQEVALQEKEAELEAMQAAMDEALLELEELKLVRLLRGKDHILHNTD